MLFTFSEIPEEVHEAGSISLRPGRCQAPVGIGSLSDIDSVVKAGAWPRDGYTLTRDVFAPQKSRSGTA